MIQKSDFACRYIGTNLNVYVSVRSQSSRLATVEHSRTQSFRVYTFKDGVTKLHLIFNVF